MYFFIIVVAFVGISVFTFLYIGMRMLFSHRLRILDRIATATSGRQFKREEDPYSLPFKDRIIFPLLVKLEKSVLKWTPTSLRLKEHHLLKLAGHPHHLTIQEWVTIRFVLWFGLGVFFTYFGIQQEAFLSKILFGSIGWILGYIGPIFYLKKKRDDRKAEIEKGLPYVLDILTVSVDAGLGFDSALVKVVEKTRGTLANEFNKTLQEIKMGKTRREALRDLGERTGADDMIQFVGSIIQAEQLGVRIGNVLRVQSEDMRQKRKQRAEEKAMKAPIKILFPLILFIFPAIFIIILGPAIINMMGTLF